MITHLGRRAVVLRLAGMAAVATVAGAALATASWASGPATPSSTATCSGSLSRDSKGASSGEPNLLDYTFNCSADITNYTFVVNRYPDDPNVIDDFAPSPTVIQASDGQPSATETFSCAGTIPGNGFNCNAPTGTPMASGDLAQGTLDPIDPYCKRLIPGAKPGTPAEPQAQVSVIVQDTTGATDGPFPLDVTPACPAVANTTPYPTAPKPRPTTRCWTTLSKDSSPTAKEPNLVDYGFGCNGKVTAYSIVVSRSVRSSANLNAFDASPEVYLSNGAPSVNEGFTCTGLLPGSGFNCGAPAGEPMLGGHTVQGTFNTVKAYCKHLPRAGKPGTPAVPQADAQLVITDSTGAQRGPFILEMKPACPAVPSQVPSSNRHTHHRRRHSRS